MANSKGFYGQLVDNVETLTGDIQTKIYNIAKGTFNNELSAIILVLTLCFFVYTKIGKDWNREDFYKMGI